VVAAASSFATFAVGAAIPVVPFLVTGGTFAVAAATTLAAMVLAIVGGFVGFLSGGSVWRSALRMLGLATAASAVTFAVGRLIGRAVG
jgi:VIT1/CCC1 family predicted Fe2+/Mn2+ transporter